MPRHARKELTSKYVHVMAQGINIVKSPELYKYSSYKLFLLDSKILNSNVLELLNLKLEDFKNIFIISKDLDIYNFREESLQKVIDKFLKDNGLKNVQEIICKRHIKILINLLKEKSNLRYEDIGNLLGISRRTLYRIMEEQ